VSLIVYLICVLSSQFASQQHALATSWWSCWFKQSSRKKHK